MDGSVSIISSDTNKMAMVTFIDKNNAIPSLILHPILFFSWAYRPPENCSKLTVAFGMKDEDDNIEWKNGTAIDVIGLDVHHSISLENCMQNNFSLKFHGQDNGKTEFSVLNVKARLPKFSSTGDSE